MLPKRLAPCDLLSGVAEKSPQSKLAQGEHHCSPPSSKITSFTTEPTMFTSWAVAPKANPEDKEYFTSEHHAVDVAYDWSIQEHGRAMMVFCNDQEWMEVTA
jgi:hypothetical protein